MRKQASKKRRSDRKYYGKFWITITKNYHLKQNKLNQMRLGGFFSQEWIEEK